MVGVIRDGGVLLFPKTTCRENAALKRLLLESRPFLVEKSLGKKN